MVKYKLIKKYPGSPELGCTIVKNSDKYEYGSYRFITSIIENNPEFWEKVVEKDYEILSFKYGNGCPYYHTLRDNNFYVQSDQTIDSSTNYTLESQLKDVKSITCTIYSVKRLSDSEIFTIGDKVIGYNNSTAKIKTIDLVGEVSLNIGTDKHEGFSLKNLKKTKTPLFTTEDGVDIFEGDTFYYVKFKENRNSYGRVFEIVIADRPGCIYEPQYEKYFSTKEKAEEYIAKNRKPLFKTDDGVDIFEGDTVYEVKSNGKIKNKPLEWFPSIYHLNHINNNNNLSFSTREAAEEYILMNKPCLSLSDVWDNLKVKDQKEVMKFVKSKLNK